MTQEAPNGNFQAFQGYNSSYAFPARSAGPLNQDLAVFFWLENNGGKRFEVVDECINIVMVSMHVRYVNKIKHYIYNIFKYEM